MTQTKKIRFASQFFAAALNEPESFENVEIESPDFMVRSLYIHVHQKQVFVFAEIWEMRLDLLEVVNCQN